MSNSHDMVSDALKGSWVYKFLPRSLWPYAQLARWERPIGWWLLLWPCWWSVTLVASTTIPLPTPPDPLHLLLFMAGAIVMRGAGCTYNDLVDQGIDDKVARTRSRPLPSGRVSRRQALVFLLAQLALGLGILMQFNTFTFVLGCISLVTVVIYPFMKRITWWPQLFLGLAFSWGALVGWSAGDGGLALAPVILYIGCIFWVIGYDTIYAHQDIEDDALVGVKSTARLFAEKTRPALAVLYALAASFFALAIWLAGPSWPAWLGWTAVCAHMVWQLVTIDITSPRHCLKLFKSNSHLGWLFFGGLLAACFV